MSENKKNVKKDYFCIVCGAPMPPMGIMCENCKKDPEAQANRPYTKDTAWLIRKYYADYIDKGVEPSKAVDKICDVLARSRENVLPALQGLYKE